MTREEVIAMFSDPKDRLSFYETALEFYEKENLKKEIEMLPAFFCYRLYELYHPIMKKITEAHEANGGNDVGFFGEYSTHFLRIYDLFPEIKKPHVTYNSSLWFSPWDYDSRINILQKAITEVKTKI
jgi:hypothetical protein